MNANEGWSPLDSATSHYELEEAENWLEGSETTWREGRETCCRLRKKMIGFDVQVTAVSARRELKLAEARVFLPVRLLRDIRAGLVATIFPTNGQPTLFWMCTLISL